MSRWLVFHLPTWQSDLSRDCDMEINVLFDPERPWAVVPPCHAGCFSGHRIGWEGESYATWKAAMTAVQEAA